MLKKNEYILNVKNIGEFHIKAVHSLESIFKNKSCIARLFSVFLKKHGTNILSYINDNIQKLELCGFCNKNFAKYTYDLYFENNELKIKNIKLFSDYSCKNKECMKERSKLNPNSFEHIAKRKKISLEEADKWQKEHNKSPFYLHPNESQEEYSKRQSRGKEYFKNKYGDSYKEKWKEYCNKIGKANTKEEVIKRHGEEYNKKLQNSKKQTLDNFILRYGEELGKEKYKHWVSSCIRVGIYLNERRIIDSKAAYNFFVKLEKSLIDKKICQKDEIIYCNGKDKSEYKIIYFNEDNKMKWYSLDFVITKYKIDIEFNGSKWHYNFENEENNKKYKLFEEEKNYEIKRDEIIKQHGFSIIKVWDYEVPNEIMIEQKINEIINYIEKVYKISLICYN